MMENEILKEVWQNRDAFAKQHKYNLDAMVAELKKMERKPWSRVVSREKKVQKKQERRKAVSKS